MSRGDLYQVLRNYAHSLLALALKGNDRLASGVLIIISSQILHSSSDGSSRTCRSLFRKALNARYQLRGPLSSLLTRSFLDALISRRRRGTIPLAVYSPAPKVDYDSSRRRLASRPLEKNQEARTRLRSLPFFRPFFGAANARGFTSGFAKSATIESLLRARSVLLQNSS